MCYPDEVMEEARVKNDIVDMISGYVKLRRKGANYFELYPSHNERSPSFSVSPGKQMYYCFGYDAEGSMLTPMMGYENYTFQKALSHLAGRAGVNLPKTEHSKEIRKQAEYRARLSEVNGLAANYLHYQPKVPWGRMGYEYFHGKRDPSGDTIMRFGLGYSNKTSGDLYRFLKDKGYRDGFLKDTGLVTLEERGRRDKLWDHVIFPIMNVSSCVIGFGRRVMGGEEPKYLNSPETRLFDRSRNLYSLNYARTSREGYLLICEGYLGVMSLHQAGFINAVASLGTTFTSQHASVLRRCTDQVTLTYDSDGAGIKAALRTIPILKGVGVFIKVPNMKPHKDLDELIKNLGPEAFRQRIKEAKDSFLLEVDTLRQSYRMDDPEQKTKFYQETTKKLLRFGEALERGSYLQTVAREQMIPAGESRGLINRMGMSSDMKAGDHVSHSGQIRHSVPAQGEAYFENDLYRGEDSAQDEGNSPYGGGGVGQAERPKRPGKGDGIRRPRKLLLTWFIETPELSDKIRGVITAGDFVEDLYHQVVQMAFKGQVSDDLNLAATLDRSINNEDQHREAITLFGASLKESLSSEEQKKTFSETVVKVRKSSLDAADRNAKDITQLQEITKQQAALKQLYISLD